NKQRRGAVTLERVLLLIATLLLAAALAALAAVCESVCYISHFIFLDLSKTTLRHDFCVFFSSLGQHFFFSDFGKKKNWLFYRIHNSGHTCGRDWEHHGGKCYHFTKTNLTWNDSRERCTLLGGHLVMIESQEEQLMTTDEDKFWIGLTDAETENTWKWVDGSSLSPHLEFWLHNEPDNWTGQNVEGEDCVRLGEKGATTRNLRYWTDKSCTVPHKSICEKSLEKCTCF
uniref:CD209 antigen-like protein D n=1 Tax=Cynoglossus semilaevis TaxID=244447 RepID=A0A3P8VD20_CYNSE